MLIEFTCNGNELRVEASPETRALDLIRDRLGLTGTKEGCGRGECGACTILLDGRPVNACLLPAAKLQGREVLTIEGISDGTGGLHPLQESFLDAGAVQCGFCTPGMIMSARALLECNPDPNEAEIVEALAGNICRCTGYAMIIKAVKQAGETLRGKGRDRTFKS